MIVTVEGKGKGSLLLLLLMSSLLLCEDVACHPLCGNECPPLYTNLFLPMVAASHYVYFTAKKLFLDFEHYYSRNKFFFMPAIRRCHTAGITLPDDSIRPSKIEYADDFRFVVRLLHSWNEPLLHLASEAHRLPEYSSHIRHEAERIANQSRHLQELMNNVVIQFDPEITSKVDYAVWTELPSLQSADKITRLFATYNLLRCLFGDFRMVGGYLKWLLCQFAESFEC
ncbi:prolactin-like [Heterocephalus glaber]|uniref:Prolactin n=1 Tax=Heterocephalus glaber TaxID=10181 RepID=A0AAX6T6R9_HETGA|nr:prolactin-like [Heterocephalus glaber]